MNKNYTKGKDEIHFFYITPLPQNIFDFAHFIGHRSC